MKNHLEAFVNKFVEPNDRQNALLELINLHNQTVQACAENANITYRFNDFEGGDRPYVNKRSILKNKI